MSDVATAAKIAWLEAKAVEAHEKYQSLLASVQAACAGTGCVNAWELRQALKKWNPEYLHQVREELAKAQADRWALMEALKNLLGQCENFDAVTDIPEVRSAMRCAREAIANSGGWPITIDGEVPNE